MTKICERCGRAWQVSPKKSRYYICLDCQHAEEKGEYVNQKARLCRRIRNRQYR